MDRTFRDWELGVISALVPHQIDEAAAQPVIEAAREHWAESGLDPWEANGSPRDFAGRVAAERAPEDRADDLRKAQGPGEWLGNVVLFLPLFLILVTLVGGLLEGSWSFALTPARSAGGVLFALAFVANFALPETVRKAGHPRWGAWTLVPGLLLMVLTVLAFSVLPTTELFTVPAPAFIGFLVVAAVVPLLPWPGGRAVDGGLAVDGGRARSYVDEPERWFRRLEDLLIGRYDLPPRLAAAQVGEARAHVGEGDPAEEFGRPEIYAAQLAVAETARSQPWWLSDLTETAFVVFFLVLARNHVTGWVTDGGIGRLVVAVSVAAVVALTVVVVLVRAFVRWGQSRLDPDESGALPGSTGRSPGRSAPNRPESLRPRAAELQAEQARWPGLAQAWAALPADSRARYDDWVLAARTAGIARRRASTVTRRCRSGRP